MKQYFQHFLSNSSMLLESIIFAILGSIDFKEISAPSAQEWRLDQNRKTWIENTPDTISDWPFHEGLLWSLLNLIAISEFNQISVAFEFFLNEVELSLNSENLINH